MPLREDLCGSVGTGSDADEESRLSILVRAQGCVRGIDLRGARAVVLVDVNFKGFKYTHRLGRILDEGEASIRVYRRERGMAAVHYLTTLCVDRVDGIPAQCVRDHFLC